MKLIIKCIKYLFIFIGILILYVGITVILSYIPVNKNPQNGDIEIFILTNGAHTDLVLPYQNEYYDWSTHLNLAETKTPMVTAKYASFGWGDKGFYLQTPEWKDLKPSVAFKAATYLSESAMHVTYYNEMKVGDDCKSIKITESQYKALCDYILKSFETKNNQFLKIETDQVYGNHDVFYEAKGRYSLFYTCNTWANNGLKAASQKASLFTLWDKGIFYQYK